MEWTGEWFWKKTVERTKEEDTEDERRHRPESVRNLIPVAHTCLFPPESHAPQEAHVSQTAIPPKFKICALSEVNCPYPMLRYPREERYFCSPSPWESRPSCSASAITLQCGHLQEGSPPAHSEETYGSQPSSFRSSHLTSFETNLSPHLPAPPAKHASRGKRSPPKEGAQALGMDTLKS